MTSAITEVIRRSVQSSSSATISTAVGVVAVVLLLVLLIQQELMRAQGGPRATTGVKALDTAIAPLALTFVVVVILRFATTYRYPAPNEASRGSDNLYLVPPSDFHKAQPGGQGSQTPVHGSLQRLYDVLLNPNAVYFGRERARTSSAVAIVHVVSIATQPLSVRAVITGANRHDFVAHNDCGGALVKAYRGCTVTLTFIPRRSGPRHATLVVTDSLTGRAHTVPLNGQGTDDLAPAAEK
jgi:hypothetical protein